MCLSIDEMSIGLPKDMIKSCTMVILFVVVFSLLLANYYVKEASASSISFTFSEYFLGSGSVGSAPVIITVTDPSANLDPTKYDTVTVHVVSTTDNTGIMLTLNETGPNTGIFKNSNLIFMKDNYQFTVGSTVAVTITDFAANISSTAIDLLPVTVRSTSDTTGFSTSYTETGVNTGIFSGKITFTSGSTSTNSIKAKGGDIVSIADTFGGRTTNALIVPNPNPTIGALKAEIGDTITASYGGQTATTIIGNDEVIPGGGGGGLVRPGLVLDVIAAVGGFFENVFNPPSIGNDYHNQYGSGITINGEPFDIKNYATRIQQQVLKTGQPATFDFKIYDERGAYTVSHAGMYFHFKGDPAVTNADTWISWDRYKGIETHDPSKIFSKTSVDAKTDGNFFHVTFTMTPQKPMPDSSLIMRMWDEKLAVGDVPIWGAIVIVDPNAPVPVKKIPTNQYDDYLTLEQILDKDGYYIPMILNKLHSLHDVYSSLDINWVYDKGVDKLTLVESDKSGNVLGTIVSSLSKKISQPVITDHNYFNFTTQQLYRQNVDQENAVKLAEGQKAIKLLESLGLVRQNNFESLK